MRTLAYVLVGFGSILGIVFGLWYHYNFANVYTYNEFLFHALIDYWYVYLAAFGSILIGGYILGRNQ